MIIRVHCPNPNCRKPLRIDARHCGKKIACKECDQHIRLPTAEELKLPVAAARTAGVDGAPEEEQEFEFDLLATEAVLGDKAAAEAAAKEVMIDFTCPMCDEPIQMAAEHSGKRAPCPSCRRIIQVPKTDVGQQRDWREKTAQGPTLAKKIEEKLEGAWGNKDVARVSLEALEEAKALPKERRKLTVNDWIRYGVYTFVGLAVLGIVWWGLGKYRLSSTEAAALASIDPALRDPSNPPEMRAVLQRAKGEWLIRHGDNDDQRREGFGLLHESTATTNDPQWVWALSRELATLYGQQVSLDPKQLNILVDPQSLVRLVSQVYPGEPREEVVRLLTRAVLSQAKNDPEKLDAARNLITSVIRNAVPPSRLEAPSAPSKTPSGPALDNSEQLSCLGVLAQELLRIQARDKALDVIGRVPLQGGRAMYQAGVPRQFVAAMTALALPDLEVDKSLTIEFELAKMIGHFLANQDAQGSALRTNRLSAGFAEVNLLPLLELAELSIENGRVSEATTHLAEAMKIAEIYIDTRSQNWRLRVYAHVRLCELTARTGEAAVAEQRIQKLKLDADPATGALVRALVVMAKPEGDAAGVLASIPEKSAGQALAAFHLARLQAEAAKTPSPSAIANLPEGAVQAAGRLGALMGYRRWQK